MLHGDHAKEVGPLYNDKNINRCFKQTLQFDPGLGSLPAHDFTSTGGFSLGSLTFFHLPSTHQ